MLQKMGEVIFLLRKRSFERMVKQMLNDGTIEIVGGGELCEESVLTITAKGRFVYALVISKLISPLQKTVFSKSTEKKINAFWEMVNSDCEIILRNKQQ